MLRSLGLWVSGDRPECAFWAGQSPAAPGGGLGAGVEMGGHPPGFFTAQKEILCLSQTQFAFPVFSVLTGTNAISSLQVNPSSLGIRQKQVGAQWPPNRAPGTPLSPGLSSPGLWSTAVSGSLPAPSSSRLGRSPLAASRGQRFWPWTCPSVLPGHNRSFTEGVSSLLNQHGALRQVALLGTRTLPGSTSPPPPWGSPPHPPSPWGILPQLPSPGSPGEGEGAQGWPSRQVIL